MARIAKKGIREHFRLVGVCLLPLHSLDGLGSLIQLFFFCFVLFFTSLSLCCATTTEIIVTLIRRGKWPLVTFKIPLSHHPAISAAM